MEGTFGLEEPGPCGFERGDEKVPKTVVSGIKLQIGFVLGPV